MGRRPKSQAEIDEFKNKILDTTLTLIGEDGYEGFSIRKLGPILGIAPKTVYNYFKSKEEIYLHILTRGFELIYEDLFESVSRESHPGKKLEALARAQLRFGFDNPNYYDLMFTWHVPKYNDFRGTELEPLALNELRTAMKSFELLVQIVEDVAAEHKSLSRDDARLYAIQLFSTIHGIVALKNSTILNYVHEDPESIIGPLLSSILNPFLSH